MPSKKMFLEHTYTNVWGKDITAFTTPDLKIVIELQTETDGKGSYWWTKFKTTLDRGRDDALNFSREQCLAIASIYDEIERRNTTSTL